MRSRYRVNRQCFRSFSDVCNGNGGVIDVFAVEVPSNAYGQISGRHTALYGHGVSIVHRFIPKVEREDLGRYCGIEEGKRAVSNWTVKHSQTVDDELGGLCRGTGLVPSQTGIVSSIIRADRLQSQGTDSTSGVVNGNSTIVDPRNQYSVV